MHAAKLDAQVKAAQMRLKDFETPQEHRWSELVPPRTALTFAAIWDPEEGMVTFSGARLLDSETEKGQRANRLGLLNDSPCDVAYAETDDQSQVLTIDRFALAFNDSPPSYDHPDHHGAPYPEYTPPSAGFDSLAFARDALVDAETTTCMDSHSCLTPGALRVPIPPGINTVPDSPAAASSMALASLAGVPFRRTLLNNPFRRNSGSSHSRRPDLHVQTGSRSGERAQNRVRGHDGGYHIDSAGSDVTDEGFFEDRRLTTGTFGSAPVLVEVNLSSAFSVTTTSTSRYVEVDHPSQAEQYSCERTFVDSDSDSVDAAGFSDETHDDRLSAWSTLRDAERQICFNVPLELGRRLKKQKQKKQHKHHRSSSSTAAVAHLHPNSPPATPANPAEVLARRYYNHFPSVSTSPRSAESEPSTWSGGCHGGRGCVAAATNRKGSLKRTKSLLNRVVPCQLKRHGEGAGDDRWVYVEVEHKVTQRVCAVCV